MIRIDTGPELRIGLESVDDRSQQSRVEDLGIVVEKHDEASVSRGCADVSAGRNPDVLGQHDDPARPVDLRRIGAVDHEHELRIDLLLRLN